MRCWQCNEEIKEFKRPTKRYCSKECGWMFNYYAQKERKQKRTIKVCVICLKDFDPKRTTKITCSEVCRRKRRKETLDEYDKTKRKRKYKGTFRERYVKAHREQIRVREFKLREERRKKGLCPYDGRKPEGPYLTCEKCRARDNKRR